jgi:hypothetical protein
MRSILPARQSSLDENARSASAAVFSRSFLCIVTLTQRRVLELVPAASPFVSVPGDNAASMRNLLRDCLLFLDEAQIERLTLTKLSASGVYGASALAHKTEAILQLIPSISVHLVHPNTMSAWLRSNKALVPGPQISLERQFKEVQQRAIDLAAYSFFTVDGRP